MLDPLLRRSWACAAADPLLVRHCPPNERFGFALVGALVVAQCLLVGIGAAEALLLASHGELGSAGPPLFAAVGAVLATFWASVVRLSLVNMGGRIGPEPRPPANQRERLRAMVARQFPNLARLGLYGALGVILSLASLVPVFRLLGMITPDATTGMLTLGKAMLRLGMPAVASLSLLLVVFILPILLRAYVPSLARGAYETLHQEQLRSVVQREAVATRAAWSARVAAYDLDPDVQWRKQRLDDLLLVPERP